MDRVPCHISLCASRLWNDKMARICNKASSRHRPDGPWCRLSYVNSDLSFCLSFFPTLLTTVPERHPFLSFLPLCSLSLLSLSPSYSAVVERSGRVREGCARSSKTEGENYDGGMIQPADQQGQWGPQKPHKCRRLRCKSLEAIANNSADVNGRWLHFSDRYVLKVEELGILKRIQRWGRGAAEQTISAKHTRPEHKNSQTQPWSYIQHAQHTLEPHTHKQPGIQGKLVAWNKSRARASH